MLKVLFFGSCWTTNIGNAFVNLGAIHQLREALGDHGEVYHFGGLSSYLFHRYERGGYSLSLARLAGFDFVVNSGMTQCVEHWDAAGRLFREFLEGGAKLIILGGGAGTYRDDEVDAVRSAMRSMPLHAFVSRDSYTFERYGDLAPHRHDGIDCAFYCSDYFEPMPLDLRGFNVLCFDTYLEPRLTNARALQSEAVKQQGVERVGREPGLLTRIRRSRQECAPPCPLESLDMGGRVVLRTHHTTWTEMLKPHYFDQPDCLVSDLPGDYLSLYAQAETVYSDRVHACIPALAWGNAAMLVKPGEPRIHMFARVGAGGAASSPVRLDLERLEATKRSQVDFLRGVLTGDL